MKIRYPRSGLKIVMDTEVHVRVRTEEIVRFDICRDAQHLLAVISDTFEEC